MTLYSLVLVGLVVTLLAIDYGRSKHERSRVFKLEVLVFAAAGVLVMFPELSSVLARAVGVGRGVDFVIYPLLILLVREALRSRQRQWEETQRTTALARTLAIRDARWDPLESTCRHASLSIL